MFQSWCQLAALTTFNALLNPSAAGGGGNEKLWEEWSGFKTGEKLDLTNLHHCQANILILIDPFVGSFYKGEQWRVC